LRHALTVKSSQKQTQKQRLAGSTIAGIELELKRFSNCAESISDVSI